ncbi:MAG: hypothetical protein WCS37_17545 [Chloroflexota bacterium]
MRRNQERWYWKINRRSGIQQDTGYLSREVVLEDQATERHPTDHGQSLKGGGIGRSSDGAASHRLGTISEERWYWKINRRSDIQQVRGYLSREVVLEDQPTERHPTG